MLLALHTEAAAADATYRQKLRSPSSLWMLRSDCANVTYLGAWRWWLLVVLEIGACCTWNLSPPSVRELVVLEMAIALPFQCT